MGIGHPASPPTPEEAVGYIRDLLALLEGDGDAVLSVVMEGRKVAGPVLEPNPRTRVRYGLGGLLATAQQGSEARWRWFLGEAAYPSEKHRLMRAKGWADAREEAVAAMDAALRELGWTLQAQPEEGAAGPARTEAEDDDDDPRDVFEVARDARLRQTALAQPDPTPLGQALRYCGENPGSTACLLLADAERGLAAWRRLRDECGLETEVRDIGDIDTGAAFAIRLDFPGGPSTLLLVPLAVAWGVLDGRRPALVVVDGNAPNMAALVAELRSRGLEVRWSEEDAANRRRAEGFLGSWSGTIGDGGAR